MNQAILQVINPYLRSLVLSAAVLSSTCTISRTLEQELENWKTSSSFANGAKKPTVKHWAAQDFSSEITRINQVNPSELFSNKVSDPKIKRILEEAYAKPNAVVIHAAVH